MTTSWYQSCILQSDLAGFIGDPLGTLIQFRLIDRVRADRTKLQQLIKPFHKFIVMGIDVIDKFRGFWLHDIFSTPPGYGLF